MTDVTTQLAQMTPLQRATLALKETRARLDRELLARTEPVAIVGIGCRFPGGANDTRSFWRLLAEGRDAITEVPRDRWDVDAYYDADPEADGKMYTRFGGFIDGADTFDPMFFGISPREAAAMDPQQRILLEVAWQAIEDAGVATDRLGGTRTGVYVGMSTHDYSILHARLADPAAADVHFGTGTAYSIAAGRLSYILGLQGPSMTVDTACSSSLVAVHLAVQSLRSGESDLALAGGVNVILAPDLTLFFCRAKGMAPDGRCKTFDASANGYVRSEGCGVVVLKRLSDALRDGDRIHALIRGTAVNHDGRSSGLTAPNGLAQRAVIRQALKAANVSASRISYVETHGTGTPLGDPIELQSLAAVLEEGRDGAPVAIGSLKTNLGHLEAAAGVAGLIKVVLSMQQRQIPPSLHYREPNPHAGLDGPTLRVQTQLGAWTSEQPLVAGLSSFGISGTNAHAILEEAPRADVPADEHPSAIVLPVSARTQEALRTLVSAYASELSSGSLMEVDARDVAAQAAMGRSHFDHRFVAVATSREELLAQLQGFVRGEPRYGAASGRRMPGNPPKVAFVFPGQGTQWIGMGRQLFEREPVFREMLERCDGAMSGRFDGSLVAEFFAAAPRLDQIAVVQPMLFALQVSLAALLRSWGIEADAFVGHSMGEVAAAHVAGALTLEDAAHIITTRSSLMRRANGRGGMLVTQLSFDEATQVTAAYGERVSIAASNGPASTVLSGEGEALQQIADDLTRRDRFSRFVKVEVASHSSQVDVVRDDLLAALAGVQSAEVPASFRSTVSGGEFAARLDAAYWWRNLRQPVLFTNVIRRLVDEGFTAFVELSAHPTLTLAVSETTADTKAEVLAVPAQHRERDGSQAALAVAGALHCAGYPLDWARVHRTRRPFIALPHYPFQKERFWIAANHPTPGGPEAVQSETRPKQEQRNAEREQQILADVIAITARVLEADPISIDADVPFLEMGADSLVMGKAVKGIESRFSVPLSLRRLFDDLSTARAVAGYVASQLPEEAVEEGPVPAPAVAAAMTAAPVTQPAPAAIPMPVTVGADASAMERVVAQQLQAFSQIVSTQLAAMGHAPAPVAAAVPELVAAAPAPIVAPALAETKPVSASTAASVARYRPYQPVKQGDGSGFNERQKKHVEALIARYTKKTARSKALAAEARAPLADSRACVGFRLSVKEMLYPLARQSALGSHIWDVDGNEYIDMTMGFGVNLFGHGEPFIQQALEAQLAKGIELGTRSELVLEASSLVSELTGMERVCFLNSGTEAIMTALRLARAAKGRRKVVLFENFYHGQSDLTLARRDEDAPRSYPIAPGVPPGAVEDIIVLDYGDPKALDTIRKHAGDIAAVLVEPIQSRRVDMQPREFVHELRKVTADLDIALIFDEMITGFRLHPRGAQAWYGVQADLATYGKIIGGGMPIGVIAGRAEFLDRVDGGVWQYGDTSYPRAETTFTGGTFCQHPLAMAGAVAVMREIRKQGPALHETLNRRTDGLTSSLNALFDAEEVPIKAFNAGSIFRFKYSGNLDLLFYHLVEKGIFIWEWRSCYLSTAHTDADFRQIESAVRESIGELREGGFLPERSNNAGIAPVAVSATAEIAPARRSVPLFDTQQLLWSAAEMGDDGASAYNESLVLRLRGALDLDALRSSIQSVVARHEALRTVIQEDGESQVIMPAVQIDVTVADLTRLPREARDRAADEWLRNESARRFSLTAGPLLRASVVRLTADEQLLLITVHHIVVDGWSGGVILEELGRFYAAAREGRTLALPPAPQFSDYGRMRTERSSTAEIVANDRFWREQFADGVPTLQLPLDHPRPANRSFRGARRHLTIDAAQTRELRAFARQQGATLFMTLLSTWVALLRRLTGAEDLVVGIPAAGRGLPDSEGVVGNCVIPMPLRIRAAGDPPFADLLATVKRSLIEGFDRSEFSFVKLLADIGYQKIFTGPPIFSATFNMDREIELPSFGDLSVEISAPPVNFAKFDLGANVMEHNDRLLFDLDYNTDLFDAATIDRLAGQLSMLLTEIVRAPKTLVSALPLVAGDERQRLLVDWNATGKDVPSNRCVHELFEAQAARRPDAVALLQDDVSVTYGELDIRANRLARYLRKLGVGPEERVGVCLERTPRFVEVLLAILKAGGAYVPVEATNSPERIGYMLEDSGASIVIAEETTSGSVAASGWSGRLVLVDEEAPSIDHQPSTSPVSGVTPENLAYVIYTSGSTGEPKGTEVPHRAIPGFAFGIDYATFDENQTLLQHSSISWDALTLELWPALMNGGRSVLYRGRVLTAGDLSELVARHGVTTIWLTSSVFTTFMETEPEALRGIRQLLTGGEAVSLPHVRRAAELLPETQIVNGYGPSECTVFSTCHVIPRNLPESASSVSIGRPVGDRRVYLLDERMNLVPIGVTGEIYVGGAGVGRGYLQRPALTAERFVPDAFSGEAGARLYRTGDLGRWTADGEIEFAGRRDHQVKLRGFRIELGEIEAVLGRHAQIREAAVRLWQDGSDKKLVGYVVPQAGASLDVEEVRAYAKDRLPEYMVPSVVLVLEAMPLTRNGKVDRHALPEPLWESRQQAGAYVAPRTPLEQLTAAIWSEVLGVEQVGVHDSFFDLGGHSLSATRIVSRMRKMFRVQVPVHTLFQSPTVADICLYLVDKRPALGDDQKIDDAIKRIEQMTAEEASRELHERNTVRV